MINITVLIEPCQPRDSDSCLGSSPEWESHHICANNIYWCFPYAKDMHRCCPESCNTGPLTENECNALSASGTCIYPNSAQCPSNFYINMIK